MSNLAEQVLNVILPRVELKLDMNTPLVILLMKEVFPTAASPANTTCRIDKVF